MFGKLLLLVAILAALWYGYKLVGRLNRQRKEKLSEKEKQSTESIGKMDQCPVCGIYVVADQAASCGRDGCPY